jgi:hypothetical protein
MRLHCARLGRPHFSVVWWALALSLFTALTHADDRFQISRDQAGQVLTRSSDWGDYCVYAPKRGKPVEILVVVHGSLGENQKAIDNATTYINRWTTFADQHRLLVLAPAFDRENYQRAYGGYRGLFGRKVGADEFVNNLVDAYRTPMNKKDPRFLLYGHSAGGQFVCRYCLMHPDRVRKAVLSAPGRYAFPDLDAPWPYGMGPFKRTLNWGNGDKRDIDITPDPNNWVKAATLPIAVLVGDRDTEPQPARPGHRGKTRIDLAQNWVNDMQALAKAHKQTPRIRFALIKGPGHSSKALTPACQRTLLELPAPPHQEGQSRGNPALPRRNP